MLGITRDASRDDIAKAYRKAAKKYHPDTQRTAEEKEAASIRFRVIASAYETLKDEETRKEYDYMLDNPDEVYRHYYNYYRRRYAPKVDIRIVLVVTISVISAFQYYGSMSKYNEAIDYFLNVPKYRLRATEIAKAEGLLSDSREFNRKKYKGKSKEEIKAEEESILRKIIEEKMDIRGSYSKPTYRDVLWVQLVVFPYTLVIWIYFYIRWFFKFTLLKEEYGQQEKEYLIRRYMGLSQNQWDALEAEERDNFLDLKLWVRDNFKTWKQAKDEETKAKLAESASYKRYRRWMKKGGPGQITFMEDWIIVFLTVNRSLNLLMFPFSKLFFRLIFQGKLKAIFKSIVTLDYYTLPFTSVSHGVQVTFFTLSASTRQ